MQLTPEQQNQVRESKTAEQEHTVVSFTPEQKAEWEAEVQRELAGKGENLDRLHRIRAAAEQEGFLGDLRRAIALSRKPIQELAMTIGVNWQLLSDFRSGEAELPLAALDRLVATLGLRLMQEIPHR